MVSIYLNGRLGNQLFQYVFCRISAIKNSCNFYIPSNEKDSRTFYSLCNQRLNKNLQLPMDTNPHYWIGKKLFDADLGFDDNNIKNIIQEESIDHQIRYEDIKDGTLINSFCQFESNLIHYEKEIVEDWFRFKPDLLEETNLILSKYDIERYCVIHFRGGDYKSIDRFFLPPSYFNLAKSEFLELGLKFLIITDDKEEALKFFPDDEIISNSMEIDFCLLTKFKYMIIPNSTFSWWGAWLNRNCPVVIAPSRWFNYNEGGSFFPAGVETSRFKYI